MPNGDVCAMCEYWDWGRIISKREPPECRIKHRLGWVHDTDPACEKFKLKKPTEMNNAKSIIRRTKL